MLTNQELQNLQTLVEQNGACVIENTKLSELIAGYRGYVQLLSAPAAAAEAQATPNIDETIKCRLIEAASSIRHNGDYGQLWYNRKNKQVAWVGADGDGCVFTGHTSFAEICFKLLVHGVTDVQVLDEHSPKGKDWVNLGTQGQAFDWYSFCENADGDDGLETMVVSTLTPGTWAILTRKSPSGNSYQDLVFVTNVGQDVVGFYSFFAESMLQFSQVEFDAGTSEIKQIVEVPSVFQDIRANIHLELMKNELAKYPIVDEDPEPEGDGEENPEGN